MSENDSEIVLMSMMAQSSTRTNSDFCKMLMSFKFASRCSFIRVSVHSFDVPRQTCSEDFTLTRKTVVGKQWSPTSVVKF